MADRGAMHQGTASTSPSGAPSGADSNNRLHPCAEDRWGDARKQEAPVGPPSWGGLSQDSTASCGTASTAASVYDSTSSASAARSAVGPDQFSAPRNASGRPAALQPPSGAAFAVMNNLGAHPPSEDADDDDEEDNPEYRALLRAAKLETISGAARSPAPSALWRGLGVPAVAPAAPDVEVGFSHPPGQALRGWQQLPTAVAEYEEPLPSESEVQRYLAREQQSTATRMRNQLTAAAQLLRDFASLVRDDQPRFDLLEHRVIDIKTNAGLATVELRKANARALQRRRRRVVLLALLATLFIVMFYVLRPAQRAPIAVGPAPIETGNRAANLQPDSPEPFADDKE